MNNRLLLGVSLLGLAACQGTETTGPSQPPLPPALAIADGAHSAGNPDFFWLPPMVWPTSSYANWTTNGFNGLLSPTVEICRLSASSAGSINAGTPCTATPPTMLIGDQVKKHFPPVADPSDVLTGLPGDWAHYHGKFLMPSNCNKTWFFRVRASVGGTELGFADIQCVTNILELLKVDYKKFGAAFKGTNLQIPFRVEKFALCVPAGVGPCGSASIPLATGGSVEFTDPDGQTVGAVVIPAQGGPAGPPLNISIAPCVGSANLPIDLPLFGGCVTVTTDQPELVLNNPASVFVCNLGEDVDLSSLSAAQKKRVTLHRQEGSLIEALPHVDEGCGSAVIGAVDHSLKGLLRALVQRDWKGARGQLFGLVSPKPLYARRLDVGAGGLTDEFSNFQFALPAIMEISAGDGQSAVPGTAVATAPEVLVSDLGGDPVAGATVRFLASAGGLPSSAVPVVTGADGKASNPWTLSATPGANTLTASGFGIASPTNNGPRCTVDPFQPIQGAPHPAEFAGCGEGDGPADTPEPLLLGSVTFTATGLFPGDPLPVNYGSGGWSYQIDGSPVETWFSSAVTPFTLTGTAGFGEDQNSCPLIISNTSTLWPAGVTTLYVRRNISLDEAATIRVAVAIDNDVQIFVNGVDVGPGLLVHDGCPTQGSFIREISLPAGTHVIAFRAVDRGGSSYFDAAVTIVPN